MRGAYGRDRDMRINGACQIPVLLVDEVVKQVKEAMNRTDAEKVRVTGPMLLLKEAIPGFEPEEKAIDNNMAALEDFKKRLLQTIAECSVIARCPFLPDEDSE